jgi:hypothetical protein
MINMNENIVKKLFEKHCTNFKIPFEKEVSIENARIDYEIILSEKHAVVEAKGTRSDEYMTIGQLLNAKRTHSHVFLLAPIKFLKKVWKILEETDTLTSIGLMTIGTKSLHIIKHPTPENYYCKTPIKLPKTSKKRYMFVNEADIILESAFKGQAFSIADVSKKLSISMGNAYHRIERLKKAGMIEDVLNGAHPKSFRFVKSRNMDEMIEV